MMTTTRQGKPGAKPSQRARKTGQKRQKGERAAPSVADQVPGADQVHRASIAAGQALVADQVKQADPVPLAGHVNVADQVNAADQVNTVDHVDHEEVADVAAAMEEATVNVANDVALEGDVLAPESRATEPPRQPSGAVAFQNIAEAYADYARNSWTARRVLVDRVMTTRSFCEAMEVQGDFAKQAYANFVVHSQKIGELYAEYTRQFFRPLEKLATGWTRIGR